MLEAIAYLGRARSFRGASTRELIRHGQCEFVVIGKTDSGAREVSLGVRNSSGGLEVHVDGEKRTSAAELAENLPLQVIDPDVHDLVAGCIGKFYFEAAGGKTVSEVGELDIDYLF